MTRAKALSRELKVIQLCPAGLLFPETPPEAAGEQLLLQGMIDCVFQEQDGDVIVDYKSDRVVSEQVLLQRYRRQLELYKLAYGRMSGRPVKCCILYSFSLNRAIELP